MILMKYFSHVAEIALLSSLNFCLSTEHLLRTALHVKLIQNDKEAAAEHKIY